MMQILAAVCDTGSLWSIAAIVLCLIAAVAFVFLVPLTIAYIAFPEESWPATGASLTSACFVIFGVLGVSCAYVAQSVIS